MDTDRLRELAGITEISAENKYDPIDYKYYQDSDVLVMRIGSSYTIVLHSDHLSRINNMNDDDQISITTETGDKIQVHLDNNYLNFIAPRISYNKLIRDQFDRVMRKAGRRY